MSLHKYLYAGNDPVNNLDPTGNEFRLDTLITTVLLRSVQFAASAPRLTTTLFSALEALVPIEIAAGLPGGLTTGIGLANTGAALVAFGRELQGMRIAFERARGGFGLLGIQFESWVGKLLGATETQIVIKDGIALGQKGPGLRIPAGSAIIDWIWRDSILEVKITANALKKVQTQELAKYAQAEKRGLTFIFLKKPTSQEVDKLSGWVKEVAPNTEVGINYVYKDIPFPLPPSQ